MNLSLGIYSISLIFIYLIVPGFLFRRFYYNGEFSKQLNPYKNQVLNVINSTFAGLILIFVFTTIINCSDISIKFNDVLVNFKKQYIENKDIMFFKNNDEIYIKYIPYILSLYTFSAFFGYFISSLILLFGFDVKFKIFRFENHWYYLFSGKIFKFKKFKLNKNIKKLTVENIFLDVLVKNENGEALLYSGFLADYDLKVNDATKLERLHLLEASRLDPDFKSDNTPKKIPGNLFTLFGDDILNINYTYIFYDLNEVKKREFDIKSKILVVFELVLLLMIVAIFISLVLKINFFGIKVLNDVYLKSFWYRFTFFYLMTVVAGLVNPFKKDKANMKINILKWHELFLKLILIIFIISFLCFAF